MANTAKITLFGEVYEFVQCHLHTPSEQWINGQEAEAELHVVMANAAGELAVLGILVERAQEAGSPLDTLIALTDTLEAARIARLQQDVKALYESQSEWKNHCLHQSPFNIVPAAIGGGINIRHRMEFDADSSLGVRITEQNILFASVPEGEEALTFDLNSLFPRDAQGNVTGRIFSGEGSLTTPAIGDPERTVMKVKHWFIFEQTIAITSQALEQFKAMLGSDNCYAGERPVPHHFIAGKALQETVRADQHALAA